MLGYSFGGGARAGARVPRARARPAPRAVRHRAGARRCPAQADGRAHARHARALLPPATARSSASAHIAGGRTRARAGRAGRTRRRAPAAPARRRSATPTSCTRPPAGRACRGCTGYRSRRWSSRARTTRACRSATAGSSPRASPTPAARGHGRRSPLPARRAGEQRGRDPRVSRRRLTRLRFRALVSDPQLACRNVGLPGDDTAAARGDTRPMTAADRKWEAHSGRPRQARPWAVRGRKRGARRAADRRGARPACALRQPGPGRARRRRPRAAARSGPRVASRRSAPS